MHAWQAGNELNLGPMLGMSQSFDGQVGEHDLASCAFGDIDTGPSLTRPDIEQSFTSRQVAPLGKNVDL
jgi:hypothetical protein